MLVSFVVLSHHRSGSNFFCDLIQAADTTTVLNEPFSMHTSYFINNDLIEWHNNQFSDEFMHKDLLPYPGLIYYLKELRQYLFSPNSKVKGFKETLLFEKLNWLKAFLPINTKMIYLIRDPRAVINSVKKKEMWKLWDYNNNIPRFIFSNPFFRELGLSISDIVDNPCNLIIFSWKIRYFYAKVRNPFHTLTVRLEDLIDKPMDTMETICSFLNIPKTNEFFDFIKQSHCENGLYEYSLKRTKSTIIEGWKNGLSNFEKELIEHMLYHEMVEQGYLPK